MKNHIQAASKALFWMFLLQGISFVLLGIAIILYPEILFALVAAFFIWIGITIILIALRVRKFNKAVEIIEVDTTIV